MMWIQLVQKEILLEKSIVGDEMYLRSLSGQPASLK